MLHYDAQGQGDPIVLLHGWALNRRVWDGLLKDLKQYGRTIAVDLPGYGKSDLPENGCYDLGTLADEVGQILEPNTSLIGWSLGGLLAMKLACRYPELIKKLIVVAGSPQFVQSDDWSNAVSNEIINGFAQELVNDYRGTILRFLAIQALGSEHAKYAITELREKVFIDGEPKLAALQEGLNLLINTNLRPELSRISCPALVILGERDTLIPASSGIETSQLINNSKLAVIQGAGHAPFISHTKEFIKLASDFINEPTK